MIHGATTWFAAMLLIPDPAPALGSRPPATDAVKAARAGWDLVWSDEFDRDGPPDPSKWTAEVGMIRNNELQYYTEGRPENARVEGGHLVLEARKEKFEDAGYTSASLTTVRSAAWTYGRIEVRAKIPTGRGMWPAIWMLGESISRWKGWPECGEIDIMENVGFDPDRIHCTVHTKAYNHVMKTQRGKSIEVRAPYEDFHVYSVEWTPEEIVFFFDDTEVNRFANEGTGTDTWPFDDPHYLILNVAVGGGWGGLQGVDETIFPRRMLVDHVRVYQRPVADLREAGRPAAARAPADGRTPKKGVGHWGKGLPVALSDLNCAWYYNWGPRPTETRETGAEFIPMIWSGKDVLEENLAHVKKAGYPALLGFNEPDSSGQADMTVKEALDLWPELEATGLRLGSPSPTTGAKWTDEFMEGARARGLRVDFLALHWYGDITRPGAVSDLHAYLEGYRKAYGLPIWLTEYSGADFDYHLRPTTEEDNARFAAESVAMLETLPYVERYAWFAAWTMRRDRHYSKTGMVNRDGSLTPVGTAYRDAGPPPRDGGLAYRLYDQDGSWKRLPDFDALTPVAEGRTWGPGTAGRGGKDFGIVLEGRLDVPRDGVWTLSTVSDDGSALWIGGDLVVANDGRHALARRDGRIGLKAGRHAFKAAYFQGRGDAGFGVFWEGPGTPREEIPSRAFTLPGS